MNFKSSAQVWDTSGHSGGALLVLLRLAWHSDDDGNSFPSIELLATKCRMTERNVKYILDALIASREVTKQKQGRHNVYRIMPVDARQVKPTSPVMPAQQVKPTSPVMPTQQVKPASKIGEAGFIRQVKPTSPQPVLNYQEPCKRGNQHTHTAGAHPTAQAPATTAVCVCLALAHLKLPGVNRGHPKLIALIADGATEAEFVWAGEDAAAKGKHFAYALGTLENMRLESANRDSAKPKGPRPVGNRRQSTADRLTEISNGLSGRTKSHETPKPLDIVDVPARRVE